jgi:sialate O-acetylesterase
MYLALPARRLSLDGSWQYHVAYDPATQPRAPFPGGPQMTPTVLFNGLINPLVPYALKGVIWYQGETNAPRAAQYRMLFPALIRDWRAQWQRPELPFLFVQIAGYQPNGNQPAESTFSELREAQQLALALPATGMATAIDVGDSTDIHPRDKQTVGHRLALQAEREVYGEKIEASGPLYQGMKVSGNKITLSFTGVGGGLVAKGGGELKQFAIAGADQQWQWAQARIEGDKVVVWNEQVPNPVAVRYAWADNPVCNLYSKVGLPTTPFRTDDWPGVTVDNTR